MKTVGMILILENYFLFKYFLLFLLNLNCFELFAFSYLQVVWIYLGYLFNLMNLFELIVYSKIHLLIISSKFQFLFSDLHQMMSLMNYFHFFHQYFDFESSYYIHFYCSSEMKIEKPIKEIQKHFFSLFFHLILSLNLLFSFLEFFPFIFFLFKSFFLKIFSVFASN